jgi:hypothetical protein
MVQPQRPLAEIDHGIRTAERGHGDAGEVRRTVCSALLHLSPPAFSRPCPLSPNR